MTNGRLSPPILSLLTPDAPQRRHDLREVFNALRWIVHTGAPWRYLPGDLPRWEAIYQQTRRWLDAGVFADMVHDLREVLRWAEGRSPTPTAAIFDSATRQSTPESGHRTGYDGYTRRKGSNVHGAGDPLGHLLAVLVTPANAQDRAQVAALAEAVQEATGSTVELALVDQGYTGEQAASEAAAHGIRVEVVKLDEAKRGLLPRRWVVARSFAWAARFRRLTKTTNACPTSSLACISSPLSASCSIDSSPPSRNVHNRL